MVALLTSTHSLKIRSNNEVTLEVPKFMIINESSQEGAKGYGSGIRDIYLTNNYIIILIYEI